VDVISKNVRKKQTNKQKERKERKLRSQRKKELIRLDTLSWIIMKSAEMVRTYGM